MNPAPIALAAGEVHVWLAFDHEFADEQVLRSFAELLEPEEIERARRARVAHLPRQRIVTRALRRTVLSAYAPGVAPADWRFATAEHGKPELALPFAHLGIHFNVAHTSRLVAMAVAREPIGVDVEHLGERRFPLDVARRYFTASEYASLAALPQSEQLQRFLAVWSLKESWIKATGEGLGADLTAVSFRFADTLRARGFAMARHGPARWRFWQGTPGDEHVLSLASRHDAEVSVFRRLPTVAWAAQTGAKPWRLVSGEEQRPET